MLLLLLEVPNKKKYKSILDLSVIQYSHNESTVFSHPNYSHLNEIVEKV